jgi:hypothetical protein
MHRRRIPEGAAVTTSMQSIVICGVNCKGDEGSKVFAETRENTQGKGRGGGEVESEEYKYKMVKNISETFMTQLTQFLLTILTPATPTLTLQYNTKNFAIH